MRWVFAILVFILIFATFRSADARNDYLNSRGCERGSIELYTELRDNDGETVFLDGDGNPDNNYNSYNDDIQGTVGVRFRWPLQSTCDTATINLMQENNRLMQELELLKTCGKYKDLELGDQFATVREMCKDVSKKPKKEKKVKKEKEFICTKIDCGDEDIDTLVKEEKDKIKETDLTPLER